MTYILTFNAGSSSIKYKLFSKETRKLAVVFSGTIEGIGEEKGIWQHTSSHKVVKETDFTTHAQAFEALGDKLQADLQGFSIVGIGHRVVHGGMHLFKPTIITDAVLDSIQKLSSLAPIHNPINAAGIVFARKYFPDALQIAVFDTGFHHTLKEFAYRYAIDKETADAHGIRRYGFHGINHEYVSLVAADYLTKPYAQSSFISLHLGNGASACLIKNGQSVDTTMGLTPLAGLIMGTRCGDIDPAIPGYLLSLGFQSNAIDSLLNKRSGLVGLAKDNDMRHLCERMQAGDSDARLAIAMYVYSIQKTIGAYLTQTPALDGLIFTGGVGENSVLIREHILSPLSHLGFNCKTPHAEGFNQLRCENIASENSYPILVIKGDEELFIAEQVTARL